MFEHLVKCFKKRTRERPFDAFQIEVTTRCLTRCVMCPRVALADRWQNMDMPWEIFQRIARAFDFTQHVHLQGWGEPLLHPRLFDMIASAKSAGCRVGLTTNGMRLDLDTARRLLSLDMDLIAISIAGASRETHEGIRVGSDFPLILENVSQLLNLRAAQGGKGPKVELSYLMTRTNFTELPQAVELAASLGVDELYANNLDYTVTPTHDQLRLYDCPELREEADRRVVEARGRARRAGIAFRAYPIVLEEVAVCEANPTKILFVSCEGWVSPCTYVTLPGQAEIPRRFQGRQVSVPVVRFGNVQEKDLAEIINDQAYRAFRQQFFRRETEAVARALMAATGEAGHEADLPPPPTPCLTCYKLYGV